MDNIEYRDLYPTEVQTMYCSQCSAHLDLAYCDFAKTVSEISITVRYLPILACPRCGAEFLPERSRFSLIRLFEEARNGGRALVEVTRRKIAEDFGYTKIPFIYDPDDYYYMPGLFREWSPGFLTPVFFNRRVLIKFDHAAGYRIRFASRTYGDVYTESNIISFGINPNDKVVMWLGDIADLPEAEQYYLRSENVQSDHRLGSEFYDAQIECKFTEPTAEDSVVSERSRLLEVASARFGTPLSHLDDETLDAIRDFYPPSAFSEREQQRLSVLVHQICG